MSDETKCDDLPCDECGAQSGEPHEDDCSRRVDYDGEED